MTPQEYWELRRRVERRLVGEDAATLSAGLKFVCFMERLRAWCVRLTLTLLGRANELVGESETLNVMRRVLQERIAKAGKYLE